MKKILFIFGTRPEAIKLFPLVIEAKKNLKSKIKLLCTGQHDSLNELYKIFNVTPDSTLELQRDTGSLSELTSILINELDKFISIERPDLIIVHGDTTSSFIGALCAFYNKIDVAHVEAGLRTHNINNPFPEEINRAFISRISKYNFCPTDISKNNLLSESVDSCSIFVVGNTVIDAVKSIDKKIETDEEIKKDLYERFPYLSKYKKIILITIHRRENWGTNLDNMLDAFRQLSNENIDYGFIFSTHPNPNLNKRVKSSLHSSQNIYVLEPQNYLNFVFLMKSSDLIYTDSGGIQEEATAINKQVFVLRDHTERPEVLATGLVEVIGVSQKAIIKSINKYNTHIPEESSPFGKGDASLKITDILKSNGY